MPALHHAGDQAKLMVCKGDERALLEKLRSTSSQREKRTPEVWLEVVITGLAVAAATQSIPGLRDRGETAEKQRA